MLPVAFAANVIRVMTLLLVTYYFGDSAGRAFHSSAAWLEIALAFVGFFAVDHLIGVFHREAGAVSQATPIVLRRRDDRHVARRAVAAA